MSKEVYFDRKAQPHELPPEITPSKRLGVYGIAVRDHQVLVVTPNWAPDKFDFPGGEAREGETEEEALKRELKEETGYDVELPDPKPFFTDFDHFYADDIRVFFNAENHYYFLNLKERPGGASDQYEVKTVSFVPLGELTPEKISRSHASALARLKQLV